MKEAKPEIFQEIGKYFFSVEAENLGNYEYGEMEYLLYRD